MICVIGRGPLSHDRSRLADTDRVVNSIYLLDQVRPHLIRASGEETMSADSANHLSQLEYNPQSSTVHAHSAETFHGALP